MPIAATMPEWMSERVETVTRPEKVEAFSSCSVVEHQRQVERLPHGLGADLAGHHVEEVRGVIEVVPRRDRLQPLGDPLAVGDRRRHLGDQALGLADVGGVVRRRGVGVGVHVAQDADGGPQDVHRVDGLRHMGEEVDQGVGDRPGGAEAAVEGVEFAAVGEVAVDQQVGGFFVGDDAGEVLDPVAAIFEAAFAFAAFEVADGRLAGDHALQARIVGVGRRGAHERIAPRRRRSADGPPRHRRTTASKPQFRRTDARVPPRRFDRGSGTRASRSRRSRRTSSRQTIARRATPRAGRRRGRRTCRR